LLEPSIEVISQITVACLTQTTVPYVWSPAKQCYLQFKKKPSLAGI